MTLIATNNGVPIIQGGKIVTDCSCCGGWYCYNACAEFSCPASAEVALTISASDYLRNAIYKFVPTNPFAGLSTYWQKETRWFKGSLINGTHILSGRKDLETALFSVWESENSFTQGCNENAPGYGKIRLTLSKGSVVDPSWNLVIPYASFTWLSEPYNESPATTGFKEGSDFSCSSLCSECSYLVTEATLYASCNKTTGIVSLRKEAFFPSPEVAYPVQYEVPFPNASPSDYSRTVEYESAQLPERWSVSGLSFQ